MIIGIGTDIIEIKRVEKMLDNSHFIKKCFTADEAATLKIKKPQSAAGYFAAKEAVSKALGTGFSGFLPCNIEITYDDNGKPCVVMHGRAEHIARDLGVSFIHVSISHCDEYAVAYAVAEGEIV